MWDDFFGDQHEGPTNWTDVAQICLNGDVINDSTKAAPQLNKKFCPKCGEETMTTCPSCGKDIAGEIHYSNVIGGHRFKRPSFCIECGKPYPWTTRNLQAAKNLANELDELSKDDQKTLKDNIDEISKDTVQAEVSAARIKKIISKVGSTTGEILQKTIVEVASETAKKILLGS